MNFLGFKSGKKDYIEFLQSWMAKFDSKLYAAFILGLLVTDGTKGAHSLIVYSVDKKALELLMKAGFSRGVIFNGPVKHKNKFSDMYKLILKGKYNLQHFKKLLDSLALTDYNVMSSDRSYEYVPEDLIRMFKDIFKNHKIAYGNNLKIEPYINLRKRPTVFTLETLLELTKNKRNEMNESEKSFIMFVENLINRKLLLDTVVSINKINQEKILYDFGTLSDNFITAHGHVMHNSKWYGQSEENLRKIFEDAEKNAPSVVFIDEVDAIAPKREEVTGEVERRVVAQLLSLMDGMRKRGRVVVIAATNRENAIDPALRRPGRFDREVEIGVPDRKGRREVLQIHTRNMPLDKSVSIDDLAARTHGFVGADVEALAKEAAISVLRRVLPEIRWREEGEIPVEIMEKLIVTSVDFENALKIVEPSAMREVLVEIPNVKWSDIGGLEDLKERLQEVIEWPLQHPDAFKKMGIKPPHGVLLYGPPGCGKTMIVKAVANEAGLNFISVKGPELLSKWVGESEKAVREIFRRARQVSPAIVFFDEIDALAPRRGLEMGSRVTEQVVSQLLTEMSGLEDLHDVIIIAATNRPDILDPALLRPGRFDRHILVSAPDAANREKIFEVHTKDMPLSKDVAIDKLAKETEGYSGADIEALCREAAIAALREDIKAKEVKWRHFEGMMKVIKPSLSPELMRAYQAVFEKMKKAEQKDELREQLSYVG
ncbi:MAG: AAA family ATPase [Candidatus Aenigmarchaeota archaeon]|nr:AAA family ATPase [Candidatus Aenigmarchaeota archaeon]